MPRAKFSRSHAIIYSELKVRFDRSLSSAGQPNH